MAVAADSVNLLNQFSVKFEMQLTVIHVWYDGYDKILINTNIYQQHRLKFLTWTEFYDQIPQNTVQFLLLFCVSEQTFSDMFSIVTALLPWEK